MREDATPMSDRYYLVLSTCPDEAVAERIAGALVDQGLAACVNLVPGVTSVYRWQGQREQSSEILLLIKTRRDVYAALQAALRAMHPYEIPEIIALPLARGLDAYLGWVDEQLR